MKNLEKKYKIEKIEKIEEKNIFLIISYKKMKKIEKMDEKAKLRQTKNIPLDNSS